MGFIEGLENESFVGVEDLLVENLLQEFGVILGFVREPVPDKGVSFFRLLNNRRSNIVHSMLVGVVCHLPT